MTQDLLSQQNIKTRDCIAILGGSFDPVHVGHVALAEVFNQLLKPTECRLIPSGWSWQKNAFKTTASERLAMLTLAFEDFAKSTALVIDDQEIKRAEQGIPSYSVDTLCQLRAQMGGLASLVFIIGADQLQGLNSWKNWQQLFDYAHIVVAARPGFSLTAINEQVRDEFEQRAASIEQLRNTPSGHTLLYADLHMAISSSQIRNGINHALVPKKVLNFIQQHHLY